MPHAFAWPAAALIAGVACGITLRLPPRIAAVALVLALGAAVHAYSRRHALRFLLLVLAGWLAAGVALGSRAERLAQAPPLRAAVLGDSGVRSPGSGDQAPRAGRREDPSLGRAPDDAVATPSRPRYRGRTHDLDQVVTIVGRLRQDAAVLPQGVGLSIEVEELPRGPAAAACERRCDADRARQPCGRTHLRLACGPPAAGAGDAEGAGAVPGPGRAGPAALARPAWHGARRIRQERSAGGGRRTRVVARGARRVRATPHPAADGGKRRVVGSDDGCDRDRHPDWRSRRPRRSDRARSAGGRHVPRDRDFRRQHRHPRGLPAR